LRVDADWGEPEGEKWLHIDGCPGLSRNSKDALARRKAREAATETRREADWERRGGVQTAMQLMMETIFSPKRRKHGWP